MPKNGDLARRYHAHSTRYLVVAKLAMDRSNGDALLGPCCQNLGLAIELYLKSRYLVQHPGADPKNYSHGLMKMWDSAWAEEVRREAASAAPSLMGKIMDGWDQPADPSRLLSPDEELRRQLKWLAKSYGPKTAYALRYPRDGTATVPSPEFLIPIFEHVMDTITPDR